MFFVGRIVIILLFTFLPIHCAWKKDKIILYASPNGESCNEMMNNTCDETSPCSLNCTFQVLSFRNTKIVDVLLFPGDYDIMTMLNTRFFMTELKTEGLQLSLKNLNSTRTRLVLGEIQIPYYTVSLFQMNAETMSVHVSGIEIVNIGPIFRGVESYKYVIFNDDLYYPPSKARSWDFSIENVVVKDIHTFISQASENVVIRNSHIERIVSLFELPLYHPTNHLVVIHNTTIFNCTDTEMLINIHYTDQNTKNIEKTTTIDFVDSRFVSIGGESTMITANIPYSNMNFTVTNCEFLRNRIPFTSVECVATANLEVVDSVFNDYSYSSEDFEFGIFSGMFVYPFFKNVNFSVSFRNTVFSRNNVTELIQFYLDVTYAQFSGPQTDILLSDPFMVIWNCSFVNNFASKNLLSITPEGYTTWVSMQKVYLAMEVEHSHFENNRVGLANIFLYRYGEMFFRYNSFAFFTPRSMIVMRIQHSKFMYSNGSSIYSSGCILFANYNEFVGNFDTPVVSKYTSKKYQFLMSSAITNSSFKNNVGVQGGGVYTTSCDLVIQDCEFDGNHAELGGAIYVGENGRLIMEDVVITRNWASFGGAIAFETNYGFCVGHRRSMGEKNEVGDVIIKDNRAWKGGAAIYVNVADAFLIHEGSERWDVYVICNPELLILSDNVVVDENEPWHELQGQDVLTAPSGIKFENSDESGYHEVGCVESIGNNYWNCSLASLWVVDYFGNYITTPTLNENLIVLTIKTESQDLQVTLSTQHRKFTKVTEHVMFYVEYKELSSQKVRMDVAFLEQTYQTHLMLQQNTFGVSWAILITSVSTLVLVILLLVFYCICCCACSFCCFSCMGTFQYHQVEKRQRRVLADKFFESYPKSVIVAESTDQESQSLSSINIEASSVPTQKNKTDVLLSHSPNFCEEEETRLLIHSPGSTFSSFQSYGTSITNNNSEDTSLSSLNSSQNKNIEIFKRLGDHHVFFGNPGSGEGTIFYVEKPSFWRNVCSLRKRKTMYYPVFSGMFDKGMKNGNGTEYHYSSGHCLHDFRLWPSMDWDEKSRKFKKKFTGHFKRGVKHGFGTEFSTQKSSKKKEVLKGKWINGHLNQIFSIEYPLRMIDIDTELEDWVKIGKGGFSTVYRARYKGKMDVAVKIFDTEEKFLKKRVTETRKSIVHIDIDEKKKKMEEDEDSDTDKISSGTTTFLQSVKSIQHCDEIGAILKRIRMFNHPHLVSILGWTGPKFSMSEFGYVMELATESVLDYYKEHKETMSIQLKDKILMDCALGMECFHDNCGLIHRDLKLDEELEAAAGGLSFTNVKICDFNVGLQDFAKDSKFAFAAGSPFHCSPESFSEEFDYKSDVYSFGIMMYELYFSKAGDPFEILETGRCPICDEVMNISSQRNLIVEMRKHHIMHNYFSESCEYIMRPLIFGEKERIGGGSFDTMKQDVEEVGELEELIEIREDDVVITTSEEEDDIITDTISSPNNWRVKLMKRCWGRPSLRPSFREIVSLYKINNKSI